MIFNFNKLTNLNDKNTIIGDFQDLEHIDGLSISSTSADLYRNKRDDVVLFYFRDGANYASVYTKSKILSENIKWNQKIRSKKIKALLVNTRNANAFTGKKDLKDLKLLRKIYQNYFRINKKMTKMNQKKSNKMKFYLHVREQLERLFQHQKFSHHFPLL